MFIKQVLFYQHGFIGFSRLHQNINLRRLVTINKEIDKSVSELRDALDGVLRNTSISKFELDLIFKYKKRLLYILKNTELSAELASLKELLAKTNDAVLFDKLINELETQRIKPDKNDELLSEVDTPGSPVIYVSGVTEFNQSKELNILLIALVNNQFPIYEIDSMYKLLKVSQLDEDVKNFITDMKKLFVLILQMDSLVLEAEVPRYEFERYLTDSIKMRETLQLISAQQDRVLKMYKDFVSVSDDQRKRALSSLGTVVKIMRLTQRNLSKETIATKLRESGSEHALNEALKIAVREMKSHHLKNLEDFRALEDKGDFDPKL